MVGDDLLEAAVQPLSVFVQDHGVSIAVKLLEREARVILHTTMESMPEMCLGEPAHAGVPGESPENSI